MSTPQMIWRRPYVDFFVTPMLAFHRIWRFNSGDPYLSIAVGPFRFRKYTWGLP